jgi:hypothetical protein
MARNLARRQLLPLLFIMARHLDAQESKDPLLELRTLQLAEKPGSVPMVYPPSIEQRAIAYQKSLQAAHAWYVGQLKTQAPMKLLAVLDKEAWQKLEPGSPYPFMPYNLWAGAVIMNADLDKLPGLRPGPLPGEFILFHETGHIFAHELKLDNPGFISEFIANIFSAAYILAERPDLKSVLEGPPPEKWPTPPRYTSFADLGYLYSSVGQANYVWFQNQLERLAGLFMEGQSLRKIVRELQSAFPSGNAMSSGTSSRSIPMEDIYARLERIRPGFRKMLGPVGAATTIPHIVPSTCPAATNKIGVLVIQNHGDDSVTVASLDGGPATVIPGHAWTKISSTVKLSNGSCLIPGDEPGLATLENP